jgi:hypothetical protein
MAFPDSEPTGLKRLVIASVRADGTGRRELLDAGHCFCISGNWGPPGYAWSPDGLEVAIVTREYRGPFESPSGQLPSDTGGLFVIDADGTDARFLRTTLGGRPLWQPAP